MGSHFSPPRAAQPDMWISGGSRGRQGFVIEAVKGRSDAAWQAMTAGITFLERAREAGMDSAFLLDVANGLHDELSNLAGQNERDLDAEHLAVDLYALDLSELDALRAKLEAAIRAKAARLVPETTYTNGSAA